MTDQFSFLDEERAAKTQEAQPSTKTEDQFSFLDEERQSSESLANLNIREAAKVDPIQSARINTLAKSNGLPHSIVSSDMPTYEEQDKADAMRSSAEGAPILKRHLANNPIVAQIAGNDIGVLAKSERSLGELFSDPIASLAGGGNSLLSMSAFLGHAVHSTPFISTIDKAIGFDEPSKYAELQKQLSEDRQSINQFKSLKLQAQEALVGNAKGVGGTFEALYENPLATTSMAIEQLPQLAPVAKGMALAKTAKGAIYAGMGASGILGGADAGTQAEQTVRQMDVNYLKENSPYFNEITTNNPNIDPELAKEMVAQRSGLVAGAIAAPVSALVGRLGAGVESRFIHQILGKQATDLTLSGAWKSVVPTLLKEGAEGSLDESLTTGAGNIGVKTQADNTQDVTEGMAESAVLGGVLQTGFGVAPASSTVILGHLNDRLKAANAEQSAERVNTLNKLASATEMVSHSNEEYQDIIKSQAEGGAESVYIDPKAFFQSNVGEKASVLSQSIREQLPSAQETGALIIIPMEEYMGQLANSEIANDILPHVKVNPEEFTKFEAEEWHKTEGARFEEEMIRVAGEHADDVAFNDSRQKVQDSIKSSLDSVGKWGSHTNETYAKLASAYFATRAAKLGITPEEMFANHGFSVGSNDSVDGSLNQKFDNPIVDAIASLSKHDESFQFPRSKAETIEGVFKDIEGKSGIEVSRYKEMDSNGEKVWKIKPDSKTMGLMFEKDGKVWIDVHDFDQGQGGKRVYAAVANYAHNTGKKFIGDHAGLSDVATTRRLENMISAVVKFGTSEHLMPHGKQVEGTEFANALDWKVGDHVHNITEMAKVSVNATKKQFPEIENISYNPSIDEFIGSDGHVWTRKDFNDLAAEKRIEAEDGDTITAGSTTIERAILFDALLHGTGEERSAILSKLSNEPPARLAKLFYQSSPKDKNLYVAHNLSEENIIAAAKLGGLAAPSLAVARSDIGFNEFNTAIVPKDISEKALKVLVDAGLAIKKYNPAIEGDRAAKIAKQKDILFQKGDVRGSFSPDTNTINLLKNANLSTFLHELGHYFYETDIKIASQLMNKESLTEGEQSIVNDVSALLKWHGIEGDANAQINTWNSMPFEEQVAMHERTAESFEHYLFTGKAPSIELQVAFRDLARWMTKVYSAIKDFLRINPEAGKLNPEVSAIFDRMLASQEQIKNAEYARSMIPLVQSMDDAESLGLTAEQFAELHYSGIDATNNATEELQTKSLKDMQWLRNARSKEIRRLKREQGDTRSEVRNQIKSEVMQEPIYQAWQWLTGKINDESKIKERAKVKKKTGVDVEQDSLLVAIAKLGGVSKESLKDAGLDEENYPIQVFGKPFARATGGRTLDDLAETLSDYGYLTKDENGKAWLNDLNEKILDESRGNKKYSTDVNAQLVFGEARAGDQVANPHGLNSARLDYESVISDQGLEIADKLKSRKMTSNVGLHPDIAANALGFESGEDLVQQLASAEPLNEKIERLTDERMLQEHGELATPKAIEEAADKAVHNTLRAKTMVREHNALANALGSKKILFAAAKEYADKMLGNMRIKDISPSRFASAEVAAARNSEKAFRESMDSQKGILNTKMAKLKDHQDKSILALHNLESAGGDADRIAEAKMDLVESKKAIDKLTKDIASQKVKVESAKKGHLEKAATEKRNQIIHNLTAKAAYDVKDEVKDAARKIKKLKKSTKMRGEANLQIADLMHRFGFTSVPNQKEKSKLADWVVTEAERLDAGEPALAGFILDESIAKPYNELTVDQFRDLVDAFTQLEMLGRRENEQYTSIRNQTFEAEKSYVLDALRVQFPDSFDAEGKPVKVARVDDSITVEKFKKKAGDSLNKIKAGFYSPENIIKDLSGGDLGVIWESLYSRMTHASDNKAEIMKRLYNDLLGAFKDYDLKERAAFSTVPVWIKEIKGAYTKEKILMIALHYGHEEGRQRLSNEGWDDSQIQAIINKLSDKDVNLVEKIWDTFDNKLWPELKALNERTVGVAPKKVKAVPYSINGRPVSGGYMALIYDRDLNGESIKQIDVMDEFRPLISGKINNVSATNKSSSNKRVESSKLLVKLSFSAFTQAVNQTVHDIAFREAGADTLRLLRDKDISRAVINSLGDSAHNALLHNLKSTLSPVREPSTIVDKAVSVAKRNTVAVLMSGANTALQNLTGYTATMSKLLKDPTALPKAMADFISNPIESTKFVLESSAYMRNRQERMDATIEELGKKLTVTGELNVPAKYSFFLMSQIDKLVTRPSWLAFYKAGMGKLDNDHDKSVDYADALIRQSQGSGREVDLPLVMNSGKSAKIFTMFYSWYNATLGLLGTETTIARRAFNKGDAKGKAVAIATLTSQVQLIVTANVIITELLMHGLPDDSDDEDRWAKAFASFGFGMFPIIRDVAGFAMSQYWAGTKFNSNYKLSPIQATAEYAVKAPGAINDWMNDDKTKRTEKDAIMGVSAILHLPGKALYDAKVTVDGWLEGEIWPAAVGPKK